MLQYTPIRTSNQDNASICKKTVEYAPIRTSNQEYAKKTLEYAQYAPIDTNKQEYAQYTPIRTNQEYARDCGWPRRP